MKLQNTHTGSFLSKTIVATAIFALTLAGSAFSQSDNFNDGDDVGWNHYSPLTPFGAGGIYGFPNGNSYRIQAPASPNVNALGGARAGSLRPDATYTDFSVSVDVLGWNATLQQGFGPVARITTPGLGTSDGYILLYFSDQNILAINRIDNELPTVLGANFLSGSAAQYHLTFSGSGANLTGQIFDLTDLVNPLATVNAVDATYASGFSGVLTSADLNTNPASATDATFDNYVAGAVPEPSAMTMLCLATLMVGSRRRSAARVKFTPI